ncbi:MAG: ATP-binding protein [Kofleriaceae bacterium]
MGALLVVGALLVAGQLVIQRALDLQQHDAHRINLAGRQRMLSQRLCMLMVANRATDGVAAEWGASQIALRGADNPAEVDRLFATIDADHHAMLDAAHAHAPERALVHQDGFLAGMDAIVAAYEADARDRVIRLRRIELALLALALVVLVLEGMVVLRPAVRAIARHLRERSAAEQAINDAGERERKRIAQDLHDGLGQQLVGINFLVKALPASPQRDELGALLAEAIDQTRQLARGLHSHTLEAGGLAAALRELAAQTERVFGIACRVEVEGGEVGEPARTHLHRIAGEAVANAVKHAGAKHIAIRVRADTGGTALEIRDDGVGISAPAADGLGLQLMAHRAQILGAELRVVRGGDGGTVVTCRVPA